MILRPSEKLLELAEKMAGVQAIFSALDDKLYCWSACPLPEATKKLVAECKKELLPFLSDRSKPKICHIWLAPFFIGGIERWLLEWHKLEGPRWRSFVLIGDSSYVSDVPNAVIMPIEGDHKRFSGMLTLLGAEVALNHCGWYDLDSPVSQIRYLHLASWVVTQSQWPAMTHATHLEYPGSQCLLVPPVLDLGPYRCKTHTDKSELKLLFPNRLSPDKIPESTLEVLAQTDLAPWVLHIYASEPPTLNAEWFRNAKRKLLTNPRIRVFDAVPFDQIPELMQQYDAVLLTTSPAVEEIGPYVIMEAMASGLPIVSRRLKAANSLCGGLYLAFEPDYQIRPLLKKLESADYRNQLGKKLRSRIEEIIPPGASRVVSDVLAASRRVDVSVMTRVKDTDPRLMQDMRESLLRQVYPFWEQIIVDNGSTRPDTVRWLQEVSDDPRVRVVWALRSFYVDAGRHGVLLNEAIKRARGEYLMNLDADDKITPEAMATLTKQMSLHPDLAAIGGRIALEGMGLSGHIGLLAWQKDSRIKPHPPFTCAMFRKDIIQKLHGFSMPRKAEDPVMWGRLNALGYKIEMLDDVVGIHVRHPDAVGVRDKEPYHELEWFYDRLAPLMGEQYGRR